MAYFKNVKSFREFVYISVSRHIKKDWGDTYEEDKLVNDADPENAMSTYHFLDVNQDFKIWVKSGCGHIIVLLPEEY